MAGACQMFCLINSWVGVFVLAVFWWVSSSEPVLLEIMTKDKNKLKDSQTTLLTSSLIYFVIAVVLTGLTAFQMLREKKNSQVGLVKLEEESETVTLKASGRKSEFTESEFDDNSGEIDFGD